MLATQINNDVLLGTDTVNNVIMFSSC